MKVRVLLVTATIGMALLGACSGDDSDSGSDSAATTAGDAAGANTTSGSGGGGGSGEAAVAASDLAFSPAEITVRRRRDDHVHEQRQLRPHVHRG